MNLIKNINKIILAFLVIVIWWFFSVFAEDPSWLLIEVNPSSFDVNTPVDFTISAIKSNWTDIVKTYVGAIIIEIQWAISGWEWTLPNEWYYEFKAADQWVKLFSKWLEIKTPWTYKIIAYDILDEGNIKWEATIIVGNPWWDTTTKKNIQIIAPIQWVIEKWNNINILWSCVDLPNSPYQVLLNWIVVAQSVTTEKWDISTYITWTKIWENTLQIKITSVDDIVLWQSDIVTFTYQSITDEIFKSIVISPSTNVKQWNKITFTVSVSDSVSSAELIFGNGKTFPMDKTAWSTFVKDVLIDFDWSTSVSLNLISAWEKKNYSDVGTITSEKNITVWDVKFVTDSLNKWTMTVKRTWFWIISKYRVKYWTDKNNLTESVEIDTNEIELQNLDPEKTYYFQITPLDANSSPIGTPSDIIEALPWHLSSGAPCVVKNIKVSTQKIWDKRYLVRDVAENATKYIIYRSEYGSGNLSNMNKVWETTETKFEYPFDKFADRNEYAYYAVEAECSDGSKIQVDNVKKVQVWPMENMVLFIVISLFFYSVYKLYNFTKND